MKLWPFLSNSSESTLPKTIIATGIAIAMLNIGIDIDHKQLNDQKAVTIAIAMLNSQRVHSMFWFTLRFSSISDSPQTYLKRIVCWAIFSCSIAKRRRTDFQLLIQLVEEDVTCWFSSHNIWLIYGEYMVNVWLIYSNTQGHSPFQPTTKGFDDKQPIRTQRATCKRCLDVLKQSMAWGCGGFNKSQGFDNQTCRKKNVA